MELNEQQVQTVKKWVAEGAGLSEIQKRLRDELKVSMTYMDVRLLALNLGLAIKDRKVAEPVKPAGKAPAAGPVDDEEPGLDEELAAPETGEAPGGAASVSVTVDRVMKPGSLVSGTVRFSDGVSGVWFLNQVGQLALQAEKAGYKPGGQDLQAFQAELRRVLERSGF
jgi:hypothetical protein